MLVAGVTMFVIGGAGFRGAIVVGLASRDKQIEETVRECENVKWLFTDGRLDAGVELEAKRQGKELKTLNMMSGASKWEVNVRCRGFEPGSPDYTAAETGIPSLLRIWAGEKVNGMDGVGLQLGFEFWKREQKTLPKASGMVAIEKGLDDATAEQGIQRAKAIADRILAIADKKIFENETIKTLQNKGLFRILSIWNYWGE